MTTPPPTNEPPPSLDGAHLRFMSPYDRLEMEKYWDRLMPSVAYLGSRSAAKIKKSLVVAYCAHRSQLRKSGEPFIIHPVEVALLLAGLKSDKETVIAGLLHDTVEDTDLTFSELEMMFGPVVRALVEGETKVSKLPTLEFEDYADEQAENLRQMFMAMTDDYRIIVVKLADRLHNMRTLRYMKPEKQEKISRETLDIFAPLAHRMGIWQFKSELEDTAFMYLYPNEYRRLNRRLRRNQTKIRVTLERSQQILRETLASDRTLGDQAENVEICGRRKELYSLWNKMRTKGEDNVSKITDVVALRVIIDPKEVMMDGLGGGQMDGGTGIGATGGGRERVGTVLCYHVLGLVQNLPGFQPVPTKVKDYISCPKPNGYQSLHTALMLNDQQIEVQIRTTAMHRVAEYGMAAHWAFYDEKKRRDRKSSLSSSPSSSSTSTNRESEEERGMEDNHDLYNTPWLSSIKEWQNEGQDDNFCSRDFVDCVRRELLGKRAFVFLRNGKILNLAKGATVIDAAFQIRTDVGLTMEGVEINGKPVPFSYELNNGDVISVLTGNGRPHTEWMKYATIRSTRSKLRSYFRQRQQEKFIDAGRTSLLHYLYVHSDLIQKYCPEIESSDDIPQNHSDIEPCLLHLLPLTSSSLSSPSELSDSKDVDEEDSIHIHDDIKDLLAEVGKRSLDGKDDQVFLRGKVADIFRVPREDLEKADLGGRINNNNDNQPYDYNNYREGGDFAEQQQGKQNVGATGENIISLSLSSSPSSLSEGKDKIRTEIADPEYLCPHCLPILGDDIIGSRLVATNYDNNKLYDDDIHGNYFATTTVHRCGCPVVPPHKTRINTRKTTNSVDGVRSTLGQYGGLSGIGFGSSDTRKVNEETNQGGASASSSSLSPGSRMSVSKATTGSTSTLECVPVRWDDSYISSPLFLAEVTIIASDRKLLLADCSEVVSSMSEIVKTGSLSTREHAILEFLVKVESLDHLQRVMNSLMGIPDVMSVERKFGSSL